MEIRLLGGVEALGGNGEPLDIGPTKCQAVFAALALSAGTAVPVGRLVDLVWGEAPPRTAEKTLQSYVTRLRKALGPDSIERIGTAYRLDVDPDRVDALRFQRHVEAGEIDPALRCWAGAPLAGLDVAGFTSVVDGLVEQWLAAREAELERLVDEDPAGAIADLTKLTVDHPFNESLWALLMTALYRSGRQADALAAYGTARRHLVDELGVEPGERLRALEAQVLGQDSRLAPAPAPNLTVPSGTVTFVFTDIEGSSTLWSSKRRDMARAVARHDELVEALTRSHGGYVFATGGDSFAVAFARAGQAAEWAIDLQAAVAIESWAGDIDLRVRIGMHTGEAEERGGDYFGPAVNLAARLGTAGHGGQIVVSQVTAGLLDRRDLRELGAFHFAGVTGDVPVVQLGEGEFAPLRTEDASDNLPRRTGRLFGRTDLLDAVVTAVGVQPLVTLVGPGGIGKTRLAIEAARIVRSQTGAAAWLVELADVASPADVVRRVADVLSVSETSGASVLDSLVAKLRQRRALLVLDNCEHVVSGAAELAEAIVAGCPDVSVLATSREGLGLAEEQLSTVGPLEASGAAVELFHARALAAAPDFDPEADRASVEELCSRLDGVPLAIELAAARVRTMTPADLVDRLDDRLRLLSGNRRHSVERHRTLRATAQWSYDLLTGPEQTLFRRLAIFAGSFDLAAVEAVTSDDELAREDVNGLLGDLVDRSMVAVVPGAFGRRFRLLETLRQFAAEHLAAAGGTRRLAERHAAYVAAEVTRIGELLGSQDEFEGAARLEEIWPNLRAALDWALDSGDRAVARALLAPVGLQSFVRRGLGEIGDWAERLLAITPPEDEDTIGWALLWAAMRHSMTQDRERFLRLYAEAGNPDHIVLARYGHLMAIEDDEFAALEIGPLAKTVMREAGQDTYARLVDVFIGAATMMKGDYAEAEETLQSAADGFRADGPPSFLNWCLYLLGAVAAFQGDDETTDRYWDESTLVDVPPHTNSPNEGLAARGAFRRGNHADAYRILAKLIDDLTESDYLAGVAMVAMEFVNMMVGCGRNDAGAAVLGHLDATGLVGVEGPGFKILLEDAIATIEADPAAMAIRAEATSELAHERAVLPFMGQVLAELLDEA